MGQEEAKERFPDNSFTNNVERERECMCVCERESRVECKNYHVNLCLATFILTLSPTSSLSQMKINMFHVSHLNINVDYGDTHRGDRKLKSGTPN